MARRNIARSGLIDQRNRATTRRRRRRGAEVVDSSPSELTEWLEAFDIDNADLQTIDLVGFLRVTSPIDLSPTERLRRLAIHLEVQAQLRPGAEGWLALKRIYHYALKLNPRDSAVLVSMGITASSWPADPEQEKEMLAAGLSALRQAVSLRPDDGHTRYTLGILEYCADDRTAALRAFEEALALASDSTTRSWAQLYKAHCLHDEQSWQAALDAYDEVDLSAFTGLRSWRIDVLREQRSHCIYHLGRTEEARRIVVEILERYEKEPHLACHAMSNSLWQVLKALSPALVARAKEIDSPADETEC